MDTKEMQAVPTPETFSALVATPAEEQSQELGPTFITRCGQPPSTDD